MSPWRSVGSVVAGTVATVALGVPTLVLLPFFGLAIGEVVGNWLPLWVFAVPPALCPVAGGTVTGFVDGGTRGRSALLGSLAAAIGVAAFGVVSGLVFLLIMLGMVPAHGQVGDLSTATLAMATIGGAAGFVVGATLGAIGGVGGHVARQRRSDR